MTIFHTPQRAYPALFVRDGAMGDVLDMTPVVRRFRLKNPDTPIHICTQHPEVFRTNPDIQKIRVERFSRWSEQVRYDQIFDLNMAQEKHLRNKHSVDCYSLEVFGDEETPKALTLVFDPKPPDLNVDWENTIAIHPAISWPQRTLPIEFWRALIVTLKVRGWNVFSLGTAQDHDLFGMGIDNGRGLFTLAQQASIINASAGFICSDTGLMAVAQTTRTPVVSLLTMTLPYMAERERFGKMGWGFYPIVANIECAGCTHEQKEPNTFFECKWTDERRNACVTRFNPEAVAWKATAVARQHKERRVHAA